jgi:hypothetical protein
MISRVVVDLGSTAHGANVESASYPCRSAACEWPPFRINLLTAEVLETEKRVSDSSI